MQRRTEPRDPATDPRLGDVVTTASGGFKVFASLPLGHTNSWLPVCAKAQALFEEGCTYPEIKDCEFSSQAYSTGQLSTLDTSSSNPIRWGDSAAQVRTSTLHADSSMRFLVHQVLAAASTATAPCAPPPDLPPMDWIWENVRNKQSRAWLPYSLLTCGRHSP